jgi:hypothetical protein
MGHLDRRSVVDGKKGSNIYKLNGDLVGHLSNARGAEKRLDKATDKLFPST